MYHDSQNSTFWQIYAVVYTSYVISKSSSLQSLVTPEPSREKNFSRTFGLVQHDPPASINSGVQNRWLMS
jgi:hypothetical protein